mmetsp:Transcript_41066/g.103474  ORF Transcript_41066/g.103474 Transcript_41066/m.103474 type:complete len:662 (-) Transcript_41066:1630-3615(-)
MPGAAARHAGAHALQAVALRLGKCLDAIGGAAEQLARVAIQRAEGLLQLLRRVEELVLRRGQIAQSHGGLHQRIQAAALHLLDDLLCDRRRTLVEGHAASARHLLRTQTAQQRRAVLLLLRVHLRLVGVHCGRRRRARCSGTGLRLLVGRRRLGSVDRRCYVRGRLQLALVVLRLGVARTTRHLEGALVEHALDVGDRDAGAGARHQRKVEHVCGLGSHLGLGGGVAQLVRLLDELTLQEDRVFVEALGVGANRRAETTFLERVHETGDTAALAKARVGFQMAEADALLAHHELQCVAVAVGADRQQLLVVTRGETLLPEAALARPVHAAQRLHRGGHALRRRVHQAQAALLLIHHHRGHEAVGTLAGHRRQECIGECEAARVQRHAHLALHAQLIERAHLLHGGDAARHAETRGELALVAQLGQATHRAQVDALHEALTLHEGHQEAAGVRLQLLDEFGHATTRLGLPAVHHHLTVARVQRHDHAIARQLLQQLRLGCGADDHALRTPVQVLAGTLHAADATAHAARCLREQLADHRLVAATTERRVQIDDGDLAGQTEAVRDRNRVTGIDLELFRIATHQLYGVTVDQINTGDDTLSGLMLTLGRPGITSILVAHRNTNWNGFTKNSLQFFNRHFTIVKDRCSQDCIGTSFESINHVFR